MMLTLMNSALSFGLIINNRPIGQEVSDMNESLMLLTITFLVFILIGEPSIYDKAHDKAMIYLSE